jgi:hypothetical protein
MSREESLLTEVIGVEVRECCDRMERPKCCFEIATNERDPPASSDVSLLRPHSVRALGAKA